MSIAISNTAQLSQFDTIKALLKSNENLARFRDDSYLQYEPNLKSKSFPNFPYIVIAVPRSEPANVVLSHETHLVEQTIAITVVTDYVARDKHLGYVNAVIRELEDTSNEATFEAVGLYNTRVTVISNEPSIIKEKQVIEGQLEVSFDGRVDR